MFLCRVSETSGCNLKLFRIIIYHYRQAIIRPTVSHESLYGEGLFRPEIRKIRTKTKKAMQNMSDR